MPAGELTEKELETLRLAAKGLNHREIGRELKVTPTAIHDRLTACRRKLGAHNTVHAVAKGFRQGLLR